MSIYLNFDIGHCETTATTIQVEDGKNVVKRLKLDGNHNDVIPSAISLSFDQIRKLGGNRIDTGVLESLGDIRIGNNASTQPTDGEYFIYFKRSPEEFDKPFGSSQAAKDAKLTCGKLMAVFIYQVVKNTLQYNDDKLPSGSKNELSLLIGCPATKKWTDEKYKEAYAQLVRTATGTQKVSIVPESRAAIFSAIGSSSKAISAANGVMVFDFGSSTADCTYMLLGRQIMEYSWDLGASLIEQQLMMNALLEAKKTDRTATPAAVLNKMLRDLRMAKEAYYQSGEEGEIVCKFSCADNKVLKQMVEVNRDTMEQVTAGDKVSIKADSVTVKTGSWQQLCKEFLEKGKAYLKDNSLPCKAIVLTGGASHMDFIAKLCREVFGRDITIKRDKNPSYCVATGLSWIAIADERHDACIEDAKKLLREDTTCNYETMKRAIQDNLCSHVFDVVSAETISWAQMPGDLPVKELEDQIRARMGRQEEQDAMKAIIVQEIDRWITQFKAGATKAINSQSEKLFSENIVAELLISDGVWKRLDANSVSVDLDPAEITKKLNISSMTNRIIQEVVFYGVAISVAVALCEIPILNVIIGYVAGIIAKAFVSDDDKNKLRNQKARLKIAKQMPKILKNNEIIDSFKSSIADTMTSVKEQYESMLNDTVNIAVDMVMFRRFSEKE